MTPTAFVSFATEDAAFVDLLERLLRFHGVDAWYSRRNLKGGDSWRRRIEGILQRTNCLVVVVSSASAESDWVKREVATFLAVADEPKVLPVLLDATDPTRIDPALSSFQYVDFQASHVDGYSALLEALDTDVPFLPLSDYVLVPNRRAQERRTSGEDRRVAPIERRLRNGFWKTYQEKTGEAKYRGVYTLDNTIHKIIDTLEDAGLLDAFEFTDASGETVDGRRALESVVDPLEDRLTSLHGKKLEADGIPLIYVVEGIARIVAERHGVEARDRRSVRGERRGS